MKELTQVGSIPGFLAGPGDPGPWPAVIVIQEWWGINDQICSVAARLAALGYLAFAPDLYHGESAALGDSDRAAELVQKYGPGAPAELGRVYDALKSRPDCTGKIGAVGFCFGGRMALMLGLERPLDAVVTFYGGGMQQIFNRMHGFKASAVLGLFGDQDVSIPAGTIQEFDRLLDEVGVEHQVLTYPNSGHAFFRDSDAATYRPVAAADAWERVTRFFRGHLH